MAGGSYEKAAVIILCNLWVCNRVLVGVLGTQGCTVGPVRVGT